MAFVPATATATSAKSAVLGGMGFTHKVYEMKLEEITLIVPTKNEERNIGKFLSSLPPKLWLTVVDASEDETAARNPEAPSGRPNNPP